MLQDQQSSGNQYQSSANMASRGRGGNHGCGGNRGRGGRGRGFGGPNHTGANTGGQGTSKPKCQICDRSNHNALECWYRFEEDYQPNNNKKKNAGFASS
jgi:hypothetical protein